MSSNKREQADNVAKQILSHNGVLFKRHSNNTMNIKWLSMASGVLLFLGILNGWPYEYYIILRWIVCGVAVFNVVGFSKSKLTGWALVFAALAFLFNPLIPVYLNKSSWVGIDLISAIIFFLAAYSINKK